MNIQDVLPFFSAAIMFAFTASVFYRYSTRRGAHLLLWGIGLLMFGAGSFAEAYFAAVGWSKALFFVWYLFGAALNAAWLGQGTVYLLVRRKRIANGLMIVLAVGSLIATYLMWTTMPRLNATSFSSAMPISEQYRTIMPPINNGGIVRLTTPFFNTYGLITLVGGALYSAYLFWRKHILLHRVIGNVLIAVGALAVASASILTRFGLGQFLYVGELMSAILMFAGFLEATAAQPVRRPAPQLSTAKN